MARGIVALSTEWHLRTSEEDLPAAAIETRARGKGKEMPTVGTSKLRRGESPAKEDTQHPST